ncbi:MAG: hypothetical protein IAE67_08560 [Candidatus Competibacteraceae bacterium]|nr:hypothetical protein [Candidatus Competibacteraceae bacterium]
MMIKCVSFIILFVISSYLMGQTSEVPKGYKYNNYFSLAGMAGSDMYGGTAAWTHFHRVSKNRSQLKLGYGIRLHALFGVNRKLVTAPAKLTRGVTGPIAIFSDKQKNNYDTISVSRPQTNAINVFFTIQYTFARRWDLGFVLDLAGMSFGPKQVATYVSSQNQPGDYTQAQNAYPSGFNLLLLGDNNIGTLSTDLYLRFWITNKWAVTGSVQYVYNEFTTVNLLRLDNDRFRDQLFMGSLGVTFCPWRSETF